MARCEVEAGGPGQQLRDTVISGGARPEDGLLRPRAASNTVIRQALGDLALHGLVASDGNTRDRHKTWRLEGSAGLEAAGQVLGLPRPEMGGTARGAGRSGAQHAMAVNETIAAFVLGGSAPGAAGGVGTVRSWRIFSGAGWCASRAMVCDTHRFVLLSDRTSAAAAWPLVGVRLAARARRRPGRPGRRAARRRPRPVRSRTVPPAVPRQTPRGWAPAGASPVRAESAEDLHRQVAEQVGDARGVVAGVHHHQDLRIARRPLFCLH